LADFKVLIAKLGPVGISTAFAVIAAAFGLFWLVADSILPRVTTPVSLKRISDSLTGQNLTLAGKMMAIVVVSTLLHKSPDFVYKAF
jgi:hypothetical protein